MTTIELSVVRIRAPDGRTVGAGFLVAERQVLPCAPVVAAALGMPEDTPQTPQAEVCLDFPLVAPGRSLTARVILWQPESDVAGLQLDGDPPADARPVRLVIAQDLWAHAFRVFGFPIGYDDGVWASGMLRGRLAASWVQIEDVKELGYWVQPGFSGTAVWDEQLNGVVGMAGAADTDRGIRAAFTIPANLLIEAWPQLAQRSLDAGSMEYLREQLALLEAAQQNAADLHRFQPRIDELQAAIASWEGRKEPSPRDSKYQINIASAQGVVIGDGARVESPFGDRLPPSKETVPEDAFAPEDERAALQKELAQRKRNLYKLREQAAIYGAGETPLHLLNQIEAEEEESQRIAAELENLGGG